MRSRVAGVNALFRANESKRPDAERLLEDTFASALSERDARVSAIRYARFFSPDLRRLVDQLQVAHCVRHRAIDVLMLDAVRTGGFRQIVSIGPGYDMRPMRFREALAGVRYIEVDHPETLAQKKRLLDRNGRDLTGVERRPIDLGVAPLEAALEGTSLDRALPICFILEGVIHYLTPARLDDLLRAMVEVSSADHTRAILSFIRSDVYRSAPVLFVRLVELLREIPRLHFTAESLAALARAHGFDRCRTWTIDQQIEAFAPNARGRSIGLSPDVAKIDRGGI